MQTFFKVQLTSLIASGVDFLTTIACVSLVHFWYLSASILGAISGGVVSFGLSKAWVFAQSNQPVGIQLSRFILVWFGNAGLNAAGLFVATQFMGIHYLVAKTGVAILVGVSYNYFFQRDFVFSLS